MGLIGELHTDGGRAPRYRHYMRKRFTFTEPQLAVVTELLLRGRQQMGELRARASRMVQIDGLPQLREELGGLIQEGFAQASGGLERRGVEVDHGFYEDRENQSLGFTAAEPAEAEPVAPAPVPAAPPATAANPDLVQQLRDQIEELQLQHEELHDRVMKMSEQLEKIARQAGIQL